MAVFMSSEDVAAMRERFAGAGSRLASNVQADQKERTMHSIVEAGVTLGTIGGLAYWQGSRAGNPDYGQAKAMPTIGGISADVIGGGLALVASLFLKHGWMKTIAQGAGVGGIGHFIANKLYVIGFRKANEAAVAAGKATPMGTWIDDKGAPTTADDKNKVGYTAPLMAGPGNNNAMGAPTLSSGQFNRFVENGYRRAA